MFQLLMIPKTTFTDHGRHLHGKSVCVCVVGWWCVCVCVCVCVCDDNWVLKIFGGGGGHQIFCPPTAKCVCVCVWGGGDMSPVSPNK